jgi:hypothetical protein
LNGLRKEGSNSEADSQLAVSEKGSKGSFGGSWGRHAGRYAANISGSIFISLKRASRLKFWAVAARRNSLLASVRTPEAQVREAQNPVEMCEQHLDFLPPATGFHVFRSCGVRTGRVAGAFMQIPRDFARDCGEAR